VFGSLFTAPDNGERDFGSHVVSLRTKKEVAANQGGYWFHRVKIRRLGDQFYFTGEVCDHPSGVENPYKGVVFWYLLSEVEQMREFPSLEAAINSWQTSERLSAAGGEPPTNTGIQSPPGSAAAKTQS
jgi:hypothetical protein